MGVVLVGVVLLFCFQLMKQRDMVMMKTLTKSSTDCLIAHYILIFFSVCESIQ